MQVTNITNFRNNIYNVVDDIIKYNEPVHISAKNGNVVVISEDDYNSIVETLYLSSIKPVKEQIIEGLNAGDDEFEEFKW
ncbi:type II toxin-antitoxin system Phd/YefM family antitoxin [Criibacterium bergeronii]|uniref:Antitoxin n=1 Tax=Criibacterium bergeronii TaxID=1871336 RepID=A0A371IN16_9FIRM|nr:type II toxin-antitoxin system Phd/YefM family antitoxin [Criibacterium bergeronii]MBS6062532.1 type II toxin-antitoxin system Phd/YefM family antitoxin [Peptostreptococcaceae bacterium]RDY21889.1 type II toxin-antitoxin system Phd/YefM family antitoxin [Criibacterium bergeronii]TRW26814.1 type II toxin-antitoxin system Phd/YefM family antitoxin [Criibacterium bergeronii]